MVVWEDIQTAVDELDDAAGDAVEKATDHD